MSGLLIRNAWVLGGEHTPPPDSPLARFFGSSGAKCYAPAMPAAYQTDLLIEGALIRWVGECTASPGIRAVDASDWLLLPGLVDIHVHLREPGREDKETIQTGTAAAAYGGFTTVACMPNTQPTADSPEVIEYIHRQAKQYGSARVCPIASITVGLAGETPSDWRALLDAGACGFSDDGRTVMNVEIMRQLLSLSTERGFPVVSHCEDHNLAGDGVIHKGKVARMLGVPGISVLVEDTIVARDIVLAAETGGHIHIAHVSTAGAVEHIRAGKAAGVYVTAEASPHHLTLTDAAVLEHGANAKMNPPLRSQQDVDAVVTGLEDGTLNAIATDHAPHAPFEKACGLRNAPFGIVGSETCLPIILTKLVKLGHLTLERAIEALTNQPAQILGLEPGRLEPGAPADLVLVDLNRRETVDPTRFRSKSRNTPFTGWELQGWPVMTILGGKVVAER